MFPLQQNPKDPSPILLYPANNQTVWVVTEGIGINATSQIVNFTLGFPPRPVATLPNAYPSDIIYDNVTTDNSRRVWVLENNSLAYYNSITKSQSITVATTFASGSPWYMAVDRNDHFWITLTGPDRIAEYQPGGALLYHNMTNACITSAYGCGLQGIALDPRDQSIWFAELYVGRIGHLTCSATSNCSMNDYGPPSGIDTTGLSQLVVDKKGTVWFTIHAGNEFGNFSTSTGDWNLFPIGYCLDSYVNGCATGLPNAIAVDNRGQIWFSEHLAGRIANFDPTNANGSAKYGNLIEYMMPTTSPVCARKCAPLCWWMRPGPNNLIWFVAYGLGEIGYVNATVPLPFSVESQNDATVDQGMSLNIPFSATYVNNAPQLNVSITRTDLTADPPMLSWSIGPRISSTGHIEDSTIHLFAAWSSTLASRYIAVTAYNENLTVNTFVRVDVVASLTAYTTVGFAGGISVFSLVSVGMNLRSKRKLLRLASTPTSRENSD